MAALDTRCPAKYSPAYASAGMHGLYGKVGVVLVATCKHAAQVRDLHHVSLVND